MESVSSPLQGGLGYLLIAEILIVTGLTWALIGLLLKKIRYPQIQSDEVGVENNEKFLQLMKRVEELETEKQMLQAQFSANGESEKLQKTISFLENKLLSYEIVQEEISVLGELKAENENLRNELKALRGSSLPENVEQAIDQKFTEFSKESPKPEQSTAISGEIENLLSDIDKMTQEKSKG